MVTSAVFVSKIRQLHLGTGSVCEFFDQNGKLKEYLIKRLVNYALNRLPKDLKELVTLKKYKVVVDCLKDFDSQSLNDASYQVNFINSEGFRVSVDRIYLSSQYYPHLDHGVAIDENQ